MAWSVMCCGCNRLMSNDGKPFASASLSGSGLIARTPFLSELADFKTPADADEAALKFGWTVKDTEGPNHRCPDCQKPKPANDSVRGYPGVVVRRGAHVWIDR